MDWMVGRPRTLFSSCVVLFPRLAYKHTYRENLLALERTVTEARENQTRKKDCLQTNNAVSFKAGEAKAKAGKAVAAFSDDGFCV